MPGASMEGMRIVGGQRQGGLLSSIQLIWTRRSLIASLVAREIKSKYIGTSLGMLWIVLEPALLVVFYTFLFSVVFKTRLPSAMTSGVGEGRFGYALFVLGGLVPWLAFSNGLLGASRSVVANRAIITKVVFPIELLPVASVVSAQAAFIAMTLIVVVISAFTHGLTMHLLWLPVISLILMLFSIGVGYLLALVSTFFRDVSSVIPFVMTLWMYASPVVYARDAVPEPFQPYLALNPISPAIEAFRTSIVYGTAPSVGSLFSSGFVAVAVFLLGFWMFRRAQTLFVEVL